jgi:hypothetical protein
MASSPSPLLSSWQEIICYIPSISFQHDSFMEVRVLSLT